MKLIVGLGNPGEEYQNTRHNAGFMAIDNYIDESNFKKKDNYMIAEKVINAEKILFVKPLTYMNDSGQAVRKVVDYYKISLDDILIIYDDMDFNVGTIKIKASGSSGGHNGIKSIIRCLGTENFKRVRIGISKPEGDTINYVLGKFSKHDLNNLYYVFNTINRIIEDFVVLPFEKLMSKYNGWILCLMICLILNLKMEWR
mgnify:FL=1